MCYRPLARAQAGRGGGGVALHEPAAAAAGAAARDRDREEPLPRARSEPPRMHAVWVCGYLVYISYTVCFQIIGSVETMHD